MKMSYDSLIVDNGKKIILNRSFKSSPDYTAPSFFKVGTGTTTPTVSDTDLESAVTIGGGSSKAITSGYPVIDGDENDLRFKDPKGVIVGLKFKQVKKIEGRKGFVQ